MIVLFYGVTTWIDFAIEIIDTKLLFLNVVVIKDTKLSLVLSTSNVSTHIIKKNCTIPNNLARRLCIIVSDVNTKEKAKRYDRFEILSAKNGKKTGILPFVHVRTTRATRITTQ